MVPYSNRGDARPMGHLSAARFGLDNFTRTKEYMQTIAQEKTDPWVEYLKPVDSPTLINAIELLKERPQREGFTPVQIRCLFPMCGYTVTARVESRAGTQDGWSGGALLRDGDYTSGWHGVDSDYASN